MTTCGCDLEWQVQRTIGYVRQPFWSLDIKVGHHESHIFHLNFLHAVHDLLYGSHHTHKTPWHYHIPYILIIRVSERKDKGRCPLGTLYTRDWARDHCNSSPLVGGKGRAGPSSLHTTLEGPTEYVNAKWMSSVHGFLLYIKWIMFLITWIIFKNHLLDVGLTQSWETMALWMLTIINIYIFYHARGSTWIGIHWNNIWLKARSHMTSHYTRGFVSTLHDFGGVLKRPLDTFF